MHWKNAKTDSPPEDQHNVLISVNGVYYTATYVKRLNGFRIPDGCYFMPTESEIYWTEFTGSGEKDNPSDMDT